MAYWKCLRRDPFPVVDSDESFDGLNQLDHGKRNPHRALPLEINNGHKLCTPSLDGPDTRHILSPPLSTRLQNILGNHFQRKVIPVGPRFQADIPVWNGPVQRRISGHNSKWLGTEIWPGGMGKLRTSEKPIGKGRSNCCCCLSPGSGSCTKRHVLEKRLLLKCDLGPAFYSWKFDEMGMQVSESWTLKERQTFKAIMKTKSCHENDFLKHALKCFPKKRRKDIVNYYFNVYIPQHMGQLRRSASMIQIDTDDEEEINYVGMLKKSNGRTLMSSSKDVKTRHFLRASQ